MTATTSTSAHAIETQQPIRTVALVSLGCPKNLVDSEKMLGLLAEGGLIPVGSDQDADALVINTCGFLEASKTESIEQLQRAAKLKQLGRIKRLVVTGCLVQRHRAKLLQWCPQIDALLGVFDRDHIVHAVQGSARRVPDELAIEQPVYSSIAATAEIAKKRRGVGSKGYFESDQTRLRLTPRHYAYLRLSEGCNQNCAFCTIPSIRGKMRSKSLGRVLAEGRELLLDGAFELNLIGQDTTSYGDDLDGVDLPMLLQSLHEMVVQVAGSAWLRLMYAYPSRLDTAMIDAVAQLDSVVKYIDMPIQHIADPVLDRMRRHTSRMQIETLLEELRTRIPGVAIRTTLISGFPGETEVQHRQLVDFVRDFGFDALGVFTYSPEPGTVAGRLHAQGAGVPVEVAAQRQDELMLAQQEVAFAHNSAMAAKEQRVEVLVDGPAASKKVSGEFVEGVGPGAIYEGRIPSQAPQIDGVTYVRSNESLVPGQLVSCRVTGWDQYDLVAEPVQSSLQPMSQSIRLIQPRVV